MTQEIRIIKNSASRESSQREDEKEKILKLFQSSFGNDLDKKKYDWKYFIKKSTQVLIIENERLIAHCGCIEREIQIDGNIKTAAQLVDVMVENEKRGVLKKRGVFFDLVKSAIENSRDLAYGFPNERHLKLGTIHGFYKPETKIYSAEWTPKKLKKIKFYQSKNVKIESDYEKEIIEKLCKKFHDSIKKTTACSRSLEWILYRYIQHPSEKYQVEFILSRLTRKAIGLVVYKKSNVDEILIMDYISDIKDTHLVLESFSQHHLGDKKIKTWVTDCSLQQINPRKLNMQISDEHITIPTIIWGGKLEQLELRNWWATPGDTDFL